MTRIAENPVFSAFVLAGGASTRMGVDKAMLSIHGTTMIERAVATMRATGCLTSIVGTRQDLATHAPVIPDLRSGCGPLSGIEAALLAASSEVSLFMPVDLPFLPPAFFELLMQRVQQTKALVTVPRFEGIAQPLCAAYHRDLLPAVSQALDTGERKVLRVMKNAALGLCSAPETSSVDIFDVETVLAATADYAGWPVPVRHIFLNCNTPGDFRIVQQRVQ